MRVLGTKPKFSPRTASARDHGAISPACLLYFSKTTFYHNALAAELLGSNDLGLRVQVTNEDFRSSERLPTSFM